MNDNNIIEGLNKSFNEFSQNYIAFCSKFAFKRSDIKNNSVLINELMTLDVSINDLVIQLQNINFKIDAIQNQDEFDDGESDPPLDKETNKLINKTMKEMMPLFFCALMNNDKKSILKDNKFMQSAVETMSQLSYQIPNTNITSNTSTSNTKYDSSHNVDDVD